MADLAEGAVGELVKRVEVAAEAAVAAMVGRSMPLRW